MIFGCKETLSRKKEGWKIIACNVANWGVKLRMTMREGYGVKWG